MSVLNGTDNGDKLKSLRDNDLLPWNRKKIVTAAHELTLALNLFDFESRIRGNVNTSLIDMACST